MFVRPTEQYQRQFDLVGAYHRNMALGLARTTGRDYDSCLEYVKRVTAEDGRLPIKDPPMKYVGRVKGGDREFKITSFLKYVGTIDRHDLIVSPSMTVYKPKHMERSVTADYIAKNVGNRNRQKKEMFNARESGDEAMAEFKNNEQKTSKIKNNSLSGAHCSDSTILFIDTIHSSLTSTCRSATGYGNANNEKVISGNRHYWSSEVAIDNIFTVINHVDIEAFGKMMDRYGLRAPTPSEMVECIEYSTRAYWRDENKMSIIRRIADTLQPVERAAFVYTGDLYHTAKYNDSMMREFLDKLSHRPSEGVDNPKQYINSLTEEMTAFVAMLCSELIPGKSLGKFDEFDKETQGIIGATAKYISEVLEEYKEFIQFILVSDVLPSSVAALPSIVRKSAVTSDTDSTIYTVKAWLEWFSGNISFEKKSVNVGHAVSFLASSSITHILAKMSANIGVAKDQLHQYAMKSEFYYPVFALTSRAKTYFAHVGATEGKIAEDGDPELDMKGAVLKGSQSPKFITDGVKGLINRVLKMTAEDKKIPLFDIIKEVADIERKIYKSIAEGDTTFYKSGELKSADSYKQAPERSPYFHYLLWQEVFAPKYGEVQEPPYGMIKVSIAATSKTELNAWLETFDDNGLRDRLVRFLDKHGKKDLSTINVPKPIIEVSGIPKEIINGVSARRIVANLMEPYYCVLETLGFYAIDGNQTRLVSDKY
ncbi:MAG: hypothetical protein CL582_10375 [Alteromonadaceae bacterium]|nr:hypothetical protein [Alteromonadaceae bacterium]